MLKKYLSPTLVEAGCDEAGRGALAGPLFAAAVILPKEFYHKELNDSKKLTPLKRDSLREVIEREAIAWAVASVSVEEIDEINILQASVVAMHRAISKLDITPEQLLIDGNYFIKYCNLPHHTLVKGDSKYSSIAAASILAKCYRDREMERLSTLHPNYQWERNRGYPTKGHREAIAKWGATEEHRLSFKLIK